MLRSFKSFSVAAAMAGCAWASGGISSPATAQDLPEAPAAVGGDAAADSADYDELTRGPIHEAFAEQVSLEPTPGIIIDKEPPAPINEIAPENRPADDNAIWIDGYWAVSGEDEEFVWVSGVWRIPPRGNEWVPGYWAKVDKGYQWIGGFWTASDREEVSYLPAPPETLEEGPTSAAPTEDHFWVPGCWYYQNNDYAWRAGYWAMSHSSYAWVPNYYRWTPRGHVLCGGYWDYGLSQRGYLFAPVHFNRPVYRNSGFRYRPSVALDLGPLQFHLFVRPRYSHYYFGDYYGDRYSNRGFYGWSNYATRRHAYDPLFTYNVARYRDRGIDFADRVSRWHQYYDRHEDDRPRHTFRDQREFQRNHRDDDDGRRDIVNTATLGRSFKDIVKDKQDRFVDFDDRGRRDSNDIRERFNRLRQQRQESEIAGRDDDRRTDGEARDDRDGREGAREIPTFRLRDRDGRDDGRVETLRPNIDDDRRPIDEAAREDRIRQAAEEAARRGDQRDNDPRQPGGDRDATRPRDERPEQKPTAGGLARPDKNPRGNNRFDPPVDKSDFQPTPGSVRPGDGVPDNARQGADVKGGGQFGTQPDARGETPSRTRDLPFGFRRDANTRPNDDARRPSRGDVDLGGRNFNPPARVQPRVQPRGNPRGNTPSVQPNRSGNSGQRPSAQSQGRGQSRGNIQQRGGSSNSNRGSIRGGGSNRGGNNGGGSKSKKSKD